MMVSGAGVSVTVQQWAMDIGAVLIDRTEARGSTRRLRLPVHLLSLLLFFTSVEKKPTRIESF